MADSDKDSEFGGWQSVCSIPLLPGDVPSEQSLHRFARAVQILGLEVYVHPNQKGQILALSSRAIDESEAKEAYAAASWLQLTLLTRTSPHG